MEEESKITIGTHSGTFHADEVVACSLLQNYSQQFKGGQIVRSRDKQILDKCNIVVDVGGIYDPSKHRYDHHQKEFQDTLSENYQTRLSSAGLVYKHFGKEIIEAAIQKLLIDTQVSEKIGLNQQNLEQICKRMYDDFFQGIDGIDNGINRYPSDIKPLYRETLSFGSLIGMKNQLGIEEDVNENDRFFEAMDLANQIFLMRLKALFFGWMPSRTPVEQALQKRFDVHPSGKILKLDRFVMWKDHLYELEAEQKIQGQIQFVLYPESATNSNWRVQAVSIDQNSFSNRKSLKEEWRGQDIETLKKISGIENIVFVHNAGFIGGAGSFENTLKMAVQSL